MAGLKIGYARVSTDDQDLTGQRDALAALGVARDVALSLGGSVHDPTDPVGRLLFNVLAMVAEFESDLARMRTLEGTKVARAKGRWRGKQPKLSPRQEGHLVALYGAGKHTTSELEELFSITRSTVYRASPSVATSSGPGQPASVLECGCPGSMARRTLELGRGRLMRPVMTRKDTMMGPARLREGGVLSAQLSALSAESERTGSPFVRGALDALRWLVGAGPGPLTGALEMPIALRSVVHELAAAEAVICGPLSAQRDYASGVEHALMWAQFATACPPTPPQRTVAVPQQQACTPRAGAAQLSDEAAAVTSMAGRA